MLGYKRLQFNIIIRKVNKFAPMKNLRAMLFPIFWVDEVRYRAMKLVVLLVVVVLVGDITAMPLLNVHIVSSILIKGLLNYLAIT